MSTLGLFFIGFQIVGGEKTGKLDLGIFIHSVVPGGPADLEGTLKPGEWHKIPSMALGVTVPYNCDLQLPSR